MLLGIQHSALVSRPAEPRKWMPIRSCVISRAANGKELPKGTEAVQAAAAAKAAADKVRQAQFYAVQALSEQIDSLSDAHVDLSTQAQDLLTSLGLADAAQQLASSNAEAEAKIKATKGKGAGLNLQGLVGHDMAAELLERQEKQLMAKQQQHTGKDK